MSTLTIGFNQNLAKTLPRFFGGPAAVWQELGQNAARAEAKNVWVGIFRHEMMITFRDDGCGITDWSSVTTAGQSDWSGVIDPAGLGVFSYFSVSEIVVISSLGKRITLTPASLSGEPILVEDDDRYIEGTEVCLYLAPDISNPTSSRFEHFVFHTFDTHVQQSLYSIECVRSFDEDRFEYIDENVIRIPLVGDLVFNTNVPGETSTKIAVWAGQSMTEHSLPSMGVRLVWLVDPASGVRPKLPDRSSLIHDDSFNTAIACIKSTLISLSKKALRDGTQLPFPITIETALSLSMPVDVKATVKDKGRSRPKIRVSDYSTAKYLSEVVPDLTFTFDTTLEDDEVVHPKITSYGDVTFESEDEDNRVVFCHRLYLTGRRVEAAFDNDSGTLYLSPLTQSPTIVTFDTNHLMSTCHRLGIAFMVFDIIDPDSVDYPHSRSWIDSPVVDKLATIVRRSLFPNTGELEIAIDGYTKLISSLEEVVQSSWWNDKYQETTDSVHSLIENLSMITESLRADLVQV